MGKNLETFIHHRINEPEEVLEFFDASQEARAKSGLRTHFLPQLYQMKDKFYDITGMGGGRPEEEKTFDVLKWQNINTDAIQYDYEKVASNPIKNAPRIGNKYLTPEEYVIKSKEISSIFNKRYWCDERIEFNLYGLNSP